MNCERAEQLLVDYLYGELSAEDRQAFEQHLKGCPEHAREVEKLSGVLNLVRGQKPDEVPKQLSERILHLAKAELDRQTPDRRSGWAWLLRSPVAAAAVLVGVIVTVGLAVTQFSDEPGREAPETAQATRPVEAPVAGMRAFKEKAPERVAGQAEETAVLSRTVEKKEQAENLQELSKDTAAGPSPAMKPGAAPFDRKAYDQDRPRFAAKPKKARRHRRSRAKTKPRSRKRAKKGIGDFGLEGGLSGREKQKKEAVAADKPDMDDSLGHRGGWQRGATDGAGAARSSAPATTIAPAKPKPTERDEEKRFAPPPPAVRKRPVSRAPAAEATPAETPAPEPRKTAAQKPAEPAAPVEYGAEGEMALKASEESLAEESEDLATADSRAPARKTARAKKAEARDLYQQGESLLSQKNYAGALSAYRKFLSRNPHDRRAPTCRYRIAKTLFLMGRCAEAVRATNQALGASPRHAMAPSALFDLASCHIRLGQFEKARSVYRQILRDHPGWQEDAQRSLQRIEGK